MVFKGLPSAGCTPCRERKIKCDQARPSCLQCIKSGKQCVGYRDVAMLSFVNYTPSAPRKSTVKSKKNGTSTNSRTPLTRQSEQVLAPKLLTDVRISQKIDQAQDQLAKGYFQSQYIGLGYFTFIPELSKQVRIEPMLERALDAAGAIGLAHMHHPQDTREARRQYVRALQLTNGALRDPRTVSSIQTLAAVMLLGMYESVASTDLEAWERHLDGAMELLRLISPAEITSRFAKLMIQQITSLIFVSCLVRDAAVPMHIVMLARSIETVERPDDASRELELLINDWSSLRARVRVRAITDVIEMVSICGEIETRFVAWALLHSRIDPSWSFQQVHTEADYTHIFRRSYRVFADLYRARQWANFSLIKVLIASLQINCITAKPEAFAPGERLRMALSLLENMDDFCASVPHCLNHVSMESPIAELTPPIWHYSIMKPLFIAGRVICGAISMNTVSEAYQASRESPSSFNGSLNEVLVRRAGEQVAWVISRLHSISSAVGIRQADAFADILQQQWEFGAGNSTFMESLPGVLNGKDIERRPPISSFMNGSISCHHSL